MATRTPQNSARKHPISVLFCCSGQPIPGSGKPWYEGGGTEVILLAMVMVMVRDGGDGNCKTS